MTVRKLHRGINSVPNPKTRTSERVSQGPGRSSEVIPSEEASGHASGSTDGVASTGRESRLDVHVVMTLTLGLHRGACDVKPYRGRPTPLPTSEGSYLQRCVFHEPFLLGSLTRQPRVTESKQASKRIIQTPITP